MDPLRKTDPATIGDYRLLGRIGQGGMGQVYLAESLAGTSVALKVMKQLSDDPKRRERFAREVDMLRSAVGVSIANYTADGMTGDTPWLATEYVPGPTLDQHVHQHGGLDTRMTAMLGASLAEGLGHIHKAGLLHRDFKPHNVVLGDEGPKIIDFGLAVVSVEPSQLTTTGWVAGTPAWMAPEQAGGIRELTPAIDVYSLAAVLSFAVTGKTPNPRIKPSLAGVDPNLAVILAGMLADEPTDRPEAPEVCHALLQVAVGTEELAEVRAALVNETYGRYQTPEPPQRSVPPTAPDPGDYPTALVAPSDVPPRPRQPPSIERAAVAAENLRIAYAKTKEL